MTDDTTTDEYNTPDGGPAEGHAAVGYVTGQRRPDGAAPEEVRIRYERNGSILVDHVLRESGSVVGQDTGTVRFTKARTNFANTTDTVYIDRLLGARPAADD